MVGCRFSTGVMLDFGPLCERLNDRINVPVHFNSEPHSKYWHALISEQSAA
jgi:hypothetical protein